MLSKSVRTLTSLGLICCFTLLLWAADSDGLNYKLKAGTVLNYKHLLEVEQLIEMMGSEQTMESTVAADFQITGQESPNENELVFVMEIKSITFEVNNPMMDTTFVDPEPLVGRKIKKVVDAQGDQISSIEIEGGEVPQILAQLFNSGMEFLPNLPDEKLVSEQPLNLTDVDSMKSMGGTIVSKSDVEYTLVGEENFNGHKCQKIAMKGTAILEGDGYYQGSIPFALEGDSTVNGVLLFAAEEGAVVKSESEIITEMTFAFTGQQSMTIPISMTMKTTLTLDE